MLNDPDSREAQFGWRTAVRPVDQGMMLPVDRDRSTYGNSWYEEEAETKSLDFARYWRVLLKHRWVVLASIVGSAIIGISITLLMTPIFHGESTLKIDREEDRIVNVQGVEPREEEGSNDEFFQTQYGLLKSRTLAADVVDRLGLASNANFLKAMKANPAAPLAARRNAAVGQFQKDLSVSPVRGSRLVKVGFNSPDPNLAATVANTTAEEFIASNLNRRYEASGYARQFLESKLEETKDKLEASERALQDYASRQGIINVAPTTKDSNGGTQSLAVTSLVALNASLSAAQTERIKAEQRYKQSLTAAEASLPEVLSNTAIQDLDQQRAKLEAEYQEKSRIYKPDYPDLVALRAQIAELNRQIQQAMQDVQNSLKLNYDVALNQEKQFQDQVAKQQSVTLDMGQRSIQYGILQRETDTNRSLYDGLLQRYKEVGVTGGISTNNISIVDRAQVPTHPSQPRPVVNLALAILAGVGLGVLIAIVLELLDESIAAPEDIQAKLGVPLLGSSPKLPKSQTPLKALDDPRSPFSEAYYSIRTALQFSTAQGAPASMLVTSSRPAEGKSTTAMAIAKNFAKIGIDVLLVDGDMRNPSLHRLMQADNMHGLSNVLTGSMPIQEAVQPTDTPHLSFLPCGPMPPNPAELLASDSLAAFIDAGRNLYSMIIIDGPPVLGLADAPSLAAAVMGTIFVIESRGTRRGLGRTALQRLRVGHARLLGAVLTKFDAKRSSYGYGAGYAYAYEYSYGDKAQLGRS